MLLMINYLNKLLTNNIGDLKMEIMKMAIFSLGTNFIIISSIIIFLINIFVDIKYVLYLLILFIFGTGLVGLLFFNLGFLKVAFEAGLLFVAVACVGLMAKIIIFGKNII